MNRVGYLTALTRSQDPNIEGRVAEERPALPWSTETLRRVRTVDLA